MQHQPQIIVSHSNASGNSMCDVATSHWLESGSFLQGVEMHLFCHSASACRADLEYFDTKFECMGTFKTYLQANFLGGIHGGRPRAYTRKVIK